MLTIKTISALGTFSSFYLLSWTIDDTLEDVGDYTFGVYESSSPESEFIKVVDGLTNMSYQYPNSYKYDSSVHKYFKIACTHIDTGTTQLSTIFTSVFLTPRDNYAEMIIYQNNYFLENIIGRPDVKLLIKRRSGTRCPSCWDPDTFEVTKSGCQVCYSTGFKNGYYEPVQMQISFTEPGFINKVDLYDIKDSQSNVTSAWASNYPLVLPGDVIIDSTNRRFRVLQAQPTTKDGNIYLRQILQLQMIPPTDIVYKVGTNFSSTDSLRPIELHTTPRSDSRRLVDLTLISDNDTSREVTNS